MATSLKINYVEFPASNIVKTKAFFSAVFGWEFEDYGPEYTAFSMSGIEGGFFKAELASTTNTGAALVVLVTDEIEIMRDKVVSHGGKISKDIFSFPGGQRFQFIEPSGNELAVWSKI